MSDRFFVDGPLSRGEIRLDGPEAHHLLHVRRFLPGQTVALFNGDGHEYSATILSAGKREAILNVTASSQPNRELPFSLHIASAMPKGDRGDFLIEKLVELGVSAFTPLETERSIVRPRVDKLQRAVIEASKQCGRNVLMGVDPTARWLAWQAEQTGRRWIASPDAETSSHGTSREATIIAIGPEGGFSPAEVEAALASGWQKLSLGPRVLRVETAAIAAAAILGRTFDASPA